MKDKTVKISAMHKPSNLLMGMEYSYTKRIDRIVNDGWVQIDSAVYRDRERSFQRLAGKKLTKKCCR